MFGRAILVNTFIEPKLIYPATSLDPPVEIVKNFKKIVRAFIFKGTIPRIRHNTLILSKMEGGINLHDIMSKIISFRLKFLYKVLNNPNEFPLACYFLKGVLNTLLDNTYEANDDTTPQFYIIMAKIYQEYKILFNVSNYKTIYFNIIQAKKEPLDNQIKRVTATTDIPAIFKDIHENLFTTPTQKQIIYRLLFGITPTSEGLAKRHKRIFFCKLCSIEQETEVHIFYDCLCINRLKVELLKVLNLSDNSSNNLFEGIFLNVLPTESNKSVYFLKLAFIAVYRDAIWTARNHATHNNQKYSSDQLVSIFINKTKYLLKLFEGNEAVQVYLDINRSNQ